MTHIEAATAAGRNIQSVARAYKRKYTDTRTWSMYAEVAEDEMSFYPELTDMNGQAAQTMPHPARTSEADSDGLVTQTSTDTNGQMVKTSTDIHGQITRIRTDRQGSERTDRTRTRRTWWQTFKWPTWATVRTWLFDIIMLGIVFGHAALIWYECADRWKTPGAIGGGVVFAFIAGAVLISSDSSKSQTNMLAVFCVGAADLAAYWLHKRVFLDAAGNSMSEGETRFFCAVICAASFTALFLFRHSKN